MSTSQQFGESASDKAPKPTLDLTFIRQGFYVLFQGKEALVEDYRPRLIVPANVLLDHDVELPYPSSNTVDKLQVKINGTWHAFGPEQIKPLPVPQDRLPEWLGKGKTFIFNCAGSAIPQTARNLYLLKSPDNPQGDIIINGETLINIKMRLFAPKSVSYISRPQY